MQLFYLDEQGDKSLSADSLRVHPYFTMGALKIQDTQRLSLYRSIQALKDHFFPGWRNGHWEDSEIKGSYLAQAIRRHSRGLTPLRPRGYAGLTGEQLGGLVDGLFNLIHRFNPQFYFVAVDKQQVLQRYDVSEHSPVGLAYAHLQIRAALLIAEVYGQSEGGLFLADEQYQHESLFRIGEITRVRQVVQSHFPRPAAIELVLDKPLWMNKGELPADREICQLSDFGLYIVGSAVAEERWGSDNRWLRRLSPYIARHWETGDLWDGGIALVPRPLEYPNLGL